ncbi:MAG: nascent polypeptide-associated complex protein [Nanoarchaeota archaeon]|nr:nascent polypeptide-associated complex protein [Nanoarchaeota archaeon]
MMPGMNPRAMRQAMKKMGIQQVDIEAQEVIIKCSDKQIIIHNPQVAKVNMMGQQTYQIVGEEEEQSLDTMPDISEEDIKTVVEQAGCTEEDAKKAIEEAEGDLATAIIKLKG